MSSFITVKEAAKRTGKSPSSVRRLIYPIIEDDNHPERGHIQPAANEARELRLKGENFAWRMSEEFVAKIQPSPAAVEKKSEITSDVVSQDRMDLLATLQQELTIKNLQIAQQTEMITKQMELMNGLSERLREGNILIGSLQQRAALSDGREAPKEVVRASMRKSEKTAPAPVAAKVASEKKRGLLGRIFG